MAKYTVSGVIYLSDGTRYGQGDEIELSSEEANDIRYANMLTPVPEVEPTNPDEDTNSDESTSENEDNSDEGDSEEENSEPTKTDEDADTPSEE